MSNILIFSFLPPATLAGGPVRSINAIIHLVGGEHFFYVISPSKEVDGSIIDYSRYKNSTNQCFELIVRDIYSLFYLYSFIKNNRIDIIYLNSFFTYKLLFVSIFLKWFLKVNLIVAPRGELEDGALRKNYYIKIIYISIMKIFFLPFIDYFHSTSKEETLNLFLKLNLMADRVKEISNLNTLALNGKFFVESKKRTNSLKLVFFSRVVPKKNLLGLLELIYALDFVDLSLDIFGFIEDANYWKKCAELVQKNSKVKSIKVSYKGVVNADKDIFLEELSTYDFFIFPTLSENYGHVIVEALHAGVPLILNDTTPFSSIVTCYNLGYVFDFNDVKRFKTVIDECYRLDSFIHLSLKRNIHGYLVRSLDDIPGNVNKYVDLFDC